MTAIATRAHTTNWAIPAPSLPPIDRTVGDVPIDVMVEIVIPVYNEETDLAASVQRLHRFLADGFPYRTAITIADNASTDSTWAVAQRLVRELNGVQAVHLTQKGRGRALRETWQGSSAPVVAYMDVDLSTDLKALLPLVAPLVSGHSDVAIGSRLARGARVARGPKREFISRSYNLLLRTLMGGRFSDAQCGFKAMRGPVARGLLPYVQDNNWFFDTEMLVLAQRSGLRIHEVPVDWIDDPGTTVDIVATAMEDLRGMWRVTRELAHGEIPVSQLRAELTSARADERLPKAGSGLLGQLVRFGGVGAFCTLAYALLYVWFKAPLGAHGANVAALVTTAIANTALNRRLTFKVSSRRGLIRDHIGGLVAFGVAMVVTSGSLWLLHRYAPGAPTWIDVTVLTLANLLATLFRFLTLRQLMHHRRQDSAETAA